MNPQVHRGLAGGAAFLSRFLAGVPADRMLWVCRPKSFGESGAREWVERAAGLPARILSGFSSNPKIEDVERGVALFRAMRAEAVVGVGGGSVLDMAKLVNYFGSRKIGLDEHLHAPSSPAAPLRPLLAVPTTAGSGSEATHFAVVYRGQTKYSVADETIRPSHVLLVPEFTASMDAYQTACTGMDALAQGMESAWARGATDESRRSARQALRLALDHLAAAVLHPAPEDRAAMLEAAHLAGCAIDVSKTTGAHAFSYALTSEYGLPHGHAVALLLPFFAEYHLRAGIRVDSIDAPFLRRLTGAIGLDSKLPATATEIHAVLARHVNLERLSNNPVPVDDGFVHDIASGLAGKP
ncbi:MAG: iron-containing alcohol dehydrogenase [Kiritimatiellia bacterium]